MNRFLLLSLCLSLGVNTELHSSLSSKIKYTIEKHAPVDAPAIKRFQKISVHYTGWISKKGLKGYQFDSSLRRGKPFTFYAGAGQVIVGWDQVVMDMKVGEKRLVIIPSELAYGVRGSSSSHIPSNSDLIFEIEILEAI